MSEYYILRKDHKGAQSEANNVTIANRHFLMTSKKDYGHFTNDMVDFMKLLPIQKEADGSTNFLGLNEQPEEITVLSFFFAIYQQKIDEEGYDIRTKKFDQPGLTLESGQLNLTANGSKLPMNIGGLMNICNPLVPRAVLNGMEMQIQKTIEGQLEKYLISQLIYMFVSRFYSPDQGIRLYFNGRSYGYFTRQNKVDLNIGFSFRSVLSHINPEDNMRLLDHWENNVVRVFAEHKAAFQALNGDILIEKEPYENPEILESGLPYKPLIHKIILVFKKNASRDQKGALLYYSYALAAVASENRSYYDNMNKYFEFFLYTTKAPLDEKYTHIYNYYDSARGGYYQHTQEFHSDIRNNYIGQYLRYLSLSQTAYNYKDIGGFEKRLRPKVIHIRDAHHATRSLYELAVMKAFSQSGKRYFWAVGPKYRAEWHRINSDLYRPDHKRRQDGSGKLTFQSLGLPRDERWNAITDTYSVWAGLCSFQQLDNNDHCVFGKSIDVFRRTLGRPLYYNNLDDQLKDMFIGKRYSRQANTSAIEPKYFSYGIDERALVNCFYNVLDDEDKASAWRKNPSLPDPPDEQSLILKESWFYMNDLGTREIWAGKRLKYYFWDDTSDIHYRRLLSDFNTNSLDYSNTLEMMACLYKYIDTYGDLPRNYRELLLFIERMRNFNKPIYGKIPSVYNELSILYRRYNLEMQVGSPMMLNTPWAKAPISTIAKLRSRLGEHFKQKASTFPKTCIDVNQLYNIRTFYKQQNIINTFGDNEAKAKTYCENVSRMDTQTLACFGNLQDFYNFEEAPEENRVNINGNMCATQPKDLKTSADIVIPYGRRGDKYAPKVTKFETDFKMSGGVQLSPSSTQVQTQTMEPGSNAPQKPGKVVIQEGSIARLVNANSAAAAAAQAKPNWKQSEGKQVNANGTQKLKAFVQCLVDGSCAARKPLLYEVTKMLFLNTELRDQLLTIAKEMYPFEIIGGLENNEAEYFGPSPPGLILHHKINTYFNKLNTYGKFICPAAPETFAGKYFEIGPSFETSVTDLSNIQIHQINSIPASPPEVNENLRRKNNNGAKNKKNNNTKRNNNNRNSVL